MTYTSKQIKAIKKAEKLISEANELLVNSIPHMDYDITVFIGRYNCLNSIYWHFYNRI